MAGKRARRGARAARVRREARRRHQALHQRGRARPDPLGPRRRQPLRAPRAALLRVLAPPRRPLVAPRSRNREMTGSLGMPLGSSAVIGDGLILFPYVTLSGEVLR